MTDFFFLCGNETYAGIVAENLPRMRIKSDYYALATNLLCFAHKVFQNHLMAKMHTVERPDGNHRIRNFLKILYVVIYFHVILYGQGMPCPYLNFLIKYSAISTAFVAAPFLILSLTTQKLKPFSMLLSRRILPTKTSSLSYAISGVG